MSNQGRQRPIRTLECPRGTAYEEELFHYLLAIERARAEHSKHPLRLLLATMEPVPGRPVPIPQASATRLFEAFRVSLRETDVIGWYRQGRVAGAVLSESAAAHGTETSGLIEQRVGEELRERLPSSVARSMRLRVTQQGPRRWLSG